MGNFVSGLFHFLDIMKTRDEFGEINFLSSLSINIHSCTPEDGRYRVPVGIALWEMCDVTKINEAHSNPE